MKANSRKSRVLPTRGGSRILGDWRMGSQGGRRWLWLALVWLGVAGGWAAERHNVLLIIADDFATDSLKLYNACTNNVTFPPMPTVDRLARSGLTFRNAYSYPTCSPARCALLTGRYGFRTGIGYALANPFGPVLGSNEFTIPKAMSQANTNLAHALIGKWHLSFEAPDPNTLGGFSHFSGGILGELQSYTNWPRKVVDGDTYRPYTNYATTDNLKDATNWISLQGTNSWFLWLAYNASHSPLHKPPDELHSYDYLSGDPSDITNHPRPYYEAMAESLDTVTSNLLAFLGPQTNLTTIIFMGDNGTPGSVIQAPYATNQSKGTLYEGGIRVPLIIAGPKVAGTNRWTDALVSVVDLYATILELAGINLATTLPTNLVFDSQSLMPIITNATYTPTERYILAENFCASLPETRAGRAVRNWQFKLIQFDSGVQEMYDLQADPYEHTNLLSGWLTPLQQTNYVALINRLGEWQTVPSPLITGYNLQASRFAVAASYASGARCWLLRQDRLDYPVWTVVTNAVTVSLSSTATRFVDTNLTGQTSYYRVGLRPVNASTNSGGIFLDWD